MKNFLKFQIIVFYFLLSFSACSQNDGPAKEYEACCGAEPVEFTVDLPDSSSVYIFVPNAFTPNGDGTNDLFYPVLSTTVDHLDYLVIENETVTGSELLYQVQDIARDELNTKGWNGKDKNGISYKGAFTYTALCVTPSGSAFAIKGTACSIACDEDAGYFKEKEGCFYPIQSRSDGTLDRTKSNEEVDCFNQ